MRVSVVVNCGAGSVDGDEARRQQQDIEAAFAAAGAEAKVELVSGEELEGALRNAVDAAPDVVAVAGGDGSLGTAASVLAGGEVPLGVLPLGTFNHFAKDLGIPAELEDAAAVIVDGTSRPIDVAEVNDRCFVNNSSLGVYPAMVSLRDRIRERRGWGKVRAAPVAIWRVFRRLPVRRLAIESDGFRVDERTSFVFIGNGRYELGAGAAGQRSTLDGGELCLYVAAAASRGRLIGIALRALVRRPAAVTDLEEHCGAEITITAGEHHLRVALDGEVTTLRSPLRYRVRPAALLVRTSAG